MRLENAAGIGILALIPVEREAKIKPVHYWDMASPTDLRSKKIVKLFELSKIPRACIMKLLQPAPLQAHIQVMT